MRLRRSDYVAGSLGVCAVGSAWLVESLLWPTVFMVAAMTVLLWAGVADWLHSLDEHYDTTPKHEPDDFDRIVNSRLADLKGMWPHREGIE